MLETTDGRYFKTKRGVWWDLLHAEVVPEVQVLEHIIRVNPEASVRAAEDEDRPYRAAQAQLQAAVELERRGE